MHYTRTPCTHTHQAVLLSPRVPSSLVLLLVTTIEEQVTIYWIHKKHTLNDTGSQKQLKGDGTHLEVIRDQNKREREKKGNTDLNTVE